MDKQQKQQEVQRIIEGIYRCDISIIGDFNVGNETMSAVNTGGIRSFEGIRLMTEEEKLKSTELRKQIRNLVDEEWTLGLKAEPFII